MSATVDGPTVTVICNNVPRDILDACELTAAERLEFEYLDWNALERGEDSASFVRYRGGVIDLGDLVHWANPPAAYEMFGQWDGFRSDTFFSGILVRWVEEFERVIVARYYC